MPARPTLLDDPDDYNLEEDATIVQPSPILALLEEERAMQAREDLDAVTHKGTPALVRGHTQQAMGYPSAVQHTFTEPSRGYPKDAAYTPRHEETAVHEVAPPAPSDRANGVALPRVDGSEPLMAHDSSSAYASGAPPAPAIVDLSAPNDAADPIRAGRALLGALIGAIAGALLWGAVGHLTGGFEFKYGAVLVGLFTGAAAARLGGGHSKAVGVLGAVFGLAGILSGKALFEILVQPHLPLDEHIAYHATPIDLIFYVATLSTGFAVGAGALSPRTIMNRGRRVLRHAIPRLR